MMVGNTYFIGLVTVISVFLHSSVEAIDLDSCAGRCDISGTNFTFNCQCNTACKKFNDCCKDYDALCLEQVVGSCKDKCDTIGMDPNAPCQCNKPCVDHGDCCPDYQDVCGGGTTPGGVSDAELQALSEDFYALEGDNNAAKFVLIDLQGKTTQSSSQDVAPNSLLNVSSEAYETKTISLLTKLHDNYIPDCSKNEVVTAEEKEEEEAFLDAIFATALFQKCKEFLILKGYLTESNFRDTFHQIWFGLYSRGAVGSSGFEHVFLGEQKSDVSGFHNWVFFSKEEAAGRLNYNGHIDYVSFGEKGSLVAHSFVWQNHRKPISSMFVGFSPEFEMAAFTLCWYARPNAKCTLKFNGTKCYVQTYDITYGGNKFVASSYADVSL